MYECLDAENSSLYCSDKAVRCRNHAISMCVCVCDAQSMPPRSVPAGAFTRVVEPQCLSCAAKKESQLHHHLLLPSIHVSNRGWPNNTETETRGL